MQFVNLSKKWSRKWWIILISIHCCTCDELLSFMILAFLGTFVILSVVTPRQMIRCLTGGNINKYLLRRYKLLWQWCPRCQPLSEASSLCCQCLLLVVRSGIFFSSLRRAIWDLLSPEESKSPLPASDSQTNCFWNRKGISQRPAATCGYQINRPFVMLAYVQEIGDAGLMKLGNNYGRYKITGDFFWGGEEG